MFAFFGVVSSIAFIIMIIGLIKPELVIRWGTVKTRGRVLLVYGGIAVLFLLISKPSFTGRSEDTAGKETIQSIEDIPDLNSFIASGSNSNIKIKIDFFKYDVVSNYAGVAIIRVPITVINQSNKDIKLNMMWDKLSLSILNKMVQTNLADLQCNYKGDLMSNSEGKYLIRLDIPQAEWAPKI